MAARYISTCIYWINLILYLVLRNPDFVYRYDGRTYQALELVCSKPVAVGNWHIISGMMNLVFERSRGKFGSNSNILALAWMPYHDEAKFRQALFEYHQRQLINLSSSANNQAAALARDINNERNHNNPQLSVAQADNGDAAPASHGHLQARLQEQLNRPRNNRVNIDDHQPAKDFCTARLAELYQRYVSLDPSKRGEKKALTSAKDIRGSVSCDPSDICKHLDRAYGRMPDFGWLVIGNIGQLIGITLTSIVEPPNEANWPPSGATNDLIHFDSENNNNNNNGATARSQIANHSSSNTKQQTLYRVDDFEDTRPDRKCVRSNYNLRGHLDEVIMVKWNDLYQKLATVDLKGNVLIWCKVNEKFIIQTPFYNRTKSVADFQWSNDGKTALICYTDSFILVGSSSGQRHWHSMLNLDDYHITCASWTPNDDQLLLGVSNGNIVIIDLPRSDLTEVIVNQTNIRSMAWSLSELTFEPSSASPPPPSGLGMTSTSVWQANDPMLHKSQRDASTASCSPSRQQFAESMLFRRNSSTVVNHRQLPRDCSVFSRYRLCSRGPTTTIAAGGDGDAGCNRLDARHCQSAGAQNKCQRENILAVDFSNNTIDLFNGGLSDPTPRSIDVKLESYLMQWSSNGRLLAVAGFKINTSAPSVGLLRCRYSNALKFYNTSGRLVYERRLRCTKYPVTAFTWAHNDARVFVATGPRLHCAKVLIGVQKLGQLAMAKIQRHTKLPDKYDAIKAIAQGKFSSQIKQWQSRNCPIDLADKPTLASSTASSSSSDSSCLIDWKMISQNEDYLSKQVFQNNANIYTYSLPLKLLKQVDQFCSTTIRQPFDDCWSASDIVWHVPSFRQRVFCTLVCYTSDRNLGLATPSRSTKADWADKQLDANVNTDQNKIFVLYVEFQGSFWPILRARRIGFLKPEFVIFDPDDGRGPGGLQPVWPRKSTKVSDVSNCPYNATTGGAKSHLNRKMDGYYRESPLSAGGGCSSADCTSRLQSPKQLDKQQQHPSRHERPPTARSSHPLAGKGFALVERDELVRVRSNIWGTKFKMINNSNRMIKQRALLGSVEYKASILHLQPREICLITKDMSNYCCLCSKHHHSRLSQGQQVPAVTTNSSSIDEPASDKSAQFSLLDTPNIAMHSWRGDGSLTPARSKQLRGSRQEHGGARSRPPPVPPVDFQPGNSSVASPRRHNNRQPTNNQGDCLRQTGCLNVDMLRQSPRRLGYLASSSVMLPNNVLGSAYRRHPVASGSISRNDDDDHGDGVAPKDDILTVSLSRCEPVKLELQAHSSCRNTELANKKVEADRLREEQILGNNKTLKSIRSITQMIVDLSSSKSDDDDDAGWPQNKHSPRGAVGSPNKPDGLSPRATTTTTTGLRASSRFVPETPVHRPRRTLVSRQHQQLEQSRSAHSSPVHRRHQPTGVSVPTPTPTTSRSSRASLRRRSQSGARNSSQPAGGGGKPEPASQQQARLLPGNLQQASVDFGRRLGSSARRLFGGSLRSLTRMHSFSGSETEVDDCEPLVSSRRNKWPPAASPAGSASARATKLSNSIKSQVSQRLGKHLAGGNATGGARQRASSSTRAELGARPSRRPIWAGKQPADSYEQTVRDFSDSDSELSSPLVSDSDSDSDSQDETSQTFELRRAQNQNKQQQQQQHRGSQRNNNNNKYNSARDLRPHASRRRGQDQSKVTVDGQQQQTRSASVRKKSICNKPTCCCARQFKLANRTPLWNEVSQVYQLDFGGRVTQESAKNLQIDLDGSLVSLFVIFWAHISIA